MSTGLLAPVESLESKLEKISATDEAIADYKNRFMDLTINGIEDKAGFKAVYEARQEVKRTRVSLVKYAKSLKEDAIAWQRKVNAEEKRVVGELEMIEAYLQSQEDAIEAEKERIRKEAEEKENQRIQARIDALAKFGFAADYAQLKALDDESFIKLLDHAEAQWKEEQERKAEEERKAAAERERIEAERRELEELRAKQAEQQRIIDEQNRKIHEAQEREERAKREAEEQKRREEELARAQEVAAENARLAERARIEDEARQKVEREERERKAAERKAANAPDKQKLQSLIEQYRAVPLPSVKGVDAGVMLSDLFTTLDGVLNKFSEQVESL